MGLFHRHRPGRRRGRGRNVPGPEAIDEWTAEDDRVIRDATDALASLGFSARTPVTRNHLASSPAQVRINPRRELLEARDDRHEPLFDFVFPYDAEMVGDDDAYLTWVSRLAAATRRSSQLSELRGSLDHDAGRGWLGYVLDGKPRRHDFDVDGDWADADTVQELLEIFSPRDLDRWLDPDSQGGVYYWLADEHAEEFHSIIPEAEPD